MVEFADLGAVLGLFRIFLANSETGEAVENTEFAFAQTLVEDGRLGTAGKAAGAADRLGRLLGTNLGRGHDHFGLFVFR